MSRLLAIAAKAPIVSTFSARALRDAATDVRDAYAWHASTYVEQPALAEFRRSFVDAVWQAKTPKACLIAPFGYGKTASAIGLWDACFRAGLLVVPPVSCGSFTELADAVYAWLAFTVPDSAQLLAEAYDKFLVHSAETLARYDERVFGIPFDQAVIAIRDKLERGYLDFDDVSINLLAFFEQATAVVRRSGYNGLVVIIDEFQQLLGNANKGVLVALRQLIWGLRVRKLPFGLVLTMDPDTERTLSDRAGDILHRIKDDGFYLDIRHIYDHTFPARLWQQYADTLDLSPAERQAIDRPTLEALGQLCERDDLSNGPRTVINVLQRVAECWARERQVGYTPIDLVDDLLTGRIRFDGDRGVVPALVAELLHFPYFQRSPERTAALKLIAAFPRGCPEQVAKQYGLANAWRELSDDLRGEIVTETEEGLALIELQRVGRPANRLNILLRRYWMQITDQQLFAEDMVRVFRDIVLPLLFPDKAHDLSGWSGVAHIDLTADNTYAGIIEGTAATAFPLRRIAVSVRSATLAHEPIEPSGDTDIQLVFVLDSCPEATSSLKVATDLSRVICTLALGRKADQELHGSIGWIAHYLSPHPLSPAVVLSLLRYLERERLETLTERDNARIEDALSRLREWLLAELFPITLFEATGIAVVSSGASAFREFFFQLFTRRWPEYRPLARTPNWMALLRDYQHALGLVAPAAKIGQEPVTGSKIEIAALFGQKRHAGFDSYARQHGELLRLETWQGNDATIRFVPHHMELQIANIVRSRSVCDEQAIYAVLRQKGFAAAEAEQIIGLALARGLIRLENAQLVAPVAPTAIELSARLQTLRRRAQSLAASEQLSALLADFDPAVEQMAAVAWRLDQAESHIVKLEEQQLATMKARVHELRRSIMQRLPRLEQALLEPPRGTLFNHLLAVHKALAHEQENLKGPAHTFVANPDSELALSVVEALASRVETWAGQAQHYENWVIFARDFAKLHAALQRTLPGSCAIRSLKEQVDQLGRQARSVQAEIGMKGLAEVDRLRAKLMDLNRQFDALVDDRSVAYHRAAAQLRDVIVKLFDLPATLSLPDYQPADDAQSYQALRYSAARTISRAIALLEVGLVELQRETAAERRRLGHLRKRIRDLADITRNPDKLFGEETLSIRPEIEERIRRLRDQVAAYQPQSASATDTRSRLVVALADLPAGAIDISSLLAKLNGSVSRSELLHDLLQLHEYGMVRLIIDLPESEDARNDPK